MSWNKIYRIRDALLTVSKDVYHFEASKKKDKYIVWAEVHSPVTPKGCIPT